MQWPRRGSRYSWFDWWKLQLSWGYFPGGVTTFSNYLHGEEGFRPNDGSSIFLWQSGDDQREDWYRFLDKKIILLRLWSYITTWSMMMYIVFQYSQYGWSGGDKEDISFGNTLVIYSLSWLRYGPTNVSFLTLCSR